MPDFMKDDFMANAIHVLSMMGFSPRLEILQQLEQENGDLAPMKKHIWSMYANVNADPDRVLIVFDRIQSHWAIDTCKHSGMRDNWFINLKRDPNPHFDTTKLMHSIEWCTARNRYHLYVATLWF